MGGAFVAGDDQREAVCSLMDGALDRQRGVRFL